MQIRIDDDKVSKLKLEEFEYLLSSNWNRLVKTYNNGDAVSYTFSNGLYLIDLKEDNNVRDGYVFS